MWVEEEDTLEQKLIMRNKSSCNDVDNDAVMHPFPMGMVQST
jgi:hypothetical protein